MGGLMKILGQRLRKTREQRGIIQKYIASKLGVSNVSLSQYENNIRQPSLDTLRALADIYDVSTDYLLGRTSNSNPSNKKTNEIAENNFEKLLIDLDIIEATLNIPEEKKQVVVYMLHLIRDLVIDKKDLHESTLRMLLASLKSIQQEKE
jgi:transcriptional regulator with XRE-family HTH domain